MWRHGHEDVIPCSQAHVAGLIPAGSKPAHVTLMYIYVFRLFRYLGCWQRLRWLTGWPPNRSTARFPCSAVIGRLGCRGAGQWDYSSRSSGHLEQPCPGSKPPSIKHRRPAPSLPGFRCLFPGENAAGLRCCCRGSQGCISTEKLLLLLRRGRRIIPAGKNTEIRLKPGRRVMDWTDPTSERFLGPMEAATNLDLVRLDPGSCFSLE